MKKTLCFILLVLATGTSHSQYMLAKGQKQLNAGAGFSNRGLPLYIGMDFGVHPDISVGGEVSFRSYGEQYKYYYYKHHIIGIVANANYHFNRVLAIPKEWDLYAGLNVGFYIWSSTVGYPGDHASGLGFGAQVGGRYYFNEKFAVHLEGGGGNAASGGKLGISVRF